MAGTNLLNPHRRVTWPQPFQLYIQWICISSSGKCGVSSAFVQFQKHHHYSDGWPCYCSLAEPSPDLQTTHILSGGTRRGRSLWAVSYTVHMKQELWRSRDTDRVGGGWKQNSNHSPALPSSYSLGSVCCQQTAPDACNTDVPHLQRPSGLNSIQQIHTEALTELEYSTDGFSSRMNIYIGVDMFTIWDFTRISAAKALWRQTPRKTVCAVLCF